MITHLNYRGRASLRASCRARRPSPWWPLSKSQWLFPWPRQPPPAWCPAASWRRPKRKTSSVPNLRTRKRNCVPTCARYLLPVAITVPHTHRTSQILSVRPDRHTGVLIRRFKGQKLGLVCVKSDAHAFAVVTSRRSTLYCGKRAPLSVGGASRAHTPDLLTRTRKGRGLGCQYAPRLVESLQCAYQHM